MFRLFITLIFAITASAGILFANTYLAYQQTKQSTVEQDRLLMRDIKNQLVLSVIRDNDTGIFMLPYGENTADGHLLPNYLALPQTNAFGFDYVYCPFSSNTGAYNETVTLTGSNDYQVLVKNDTGTNHRDYVLYSENVVANNVLGYVISNHKRENQLSCLDVIGSDTLTFDNSLVQVIYSDELSYNNLVDNAFYNIQNNTDFNQNMVKSANRVNQHSVFLLENDVSNSSSVVFNNQSGKQSKVIIKGSGVKTIDAASPVDFTFNNMEVVFENVVLSENVNIISNHSKITFINSVIHNFNSNYSNIEFNNSTLSINNGFSFIHSYIDLINDISINATAGNALVLFNSELNGSGNSIDANGQTIINFDFTSGVSLFNTDINLTPLTQRFLRGNGVLNLNGTELLGGFNSIDATKGARLSINNSVVNSANPINDKGIMLLSGSGNVLFNDCITPYDIRKVAVEIEYESFVDGVYVGEEITLQPLMKTTEVEIDLNDQFSDFNYTCQ